MYFTTVAVLRGGPSSEYEVSLQTGASVLKVLEGTSYRVKDVVITKTGEWCVHGFVKKPEQILADVDVVFLALHGSYGEDGGVQRLLTRFGIPYTGSRAYPSTVAMNKYLTKESLSATGIKMPRSFKVSRDAMAEPVLVAQNIAELFKGPYVIKPTNAGSSHGVQIAQNVAELSLHLEKALPEYEQLLVEEYVSGVEATVALLEQYRQQSLYAFPPIEIVPPAESTYFDSGVKYNGCTEEICPGRFAPTVKEKLQKSAELVHTTLDLRQYSRSDFIIKGTEVYFLEVNTLPGLTSESLFPKAVTAVGGTYTELILHLLEDAYNTRPQYLSTGRAI